MCNSDVSNISAARPNGDHTDIVWRMLTSSGHGKIEPAGMRLRFWHVEDLSSMLKHAAFDDLAMNRNNCPHFGMTKLL